MLYLCGQRGVIFKNCNKNMRIPTQKNHRGHHPRTMLHLNGQRKVFTKVVLGFRMTSRGLGEMFEEYSADSCGLKILLLLMGGLAEGLACTDLGARTPIGVSGNFFPYLATVPKITEGDPPYPPQYDTFGRTRWVISKVVLGFQNFALARK